MLWNYFLRKIFLCGKIPIWHVWQCYVKDVMPTSFGHWKSFICTLSMPNMKSLYLWFKRLKFSEKDRQTDLIHRTQPRCHGTHLGAFDLEKSTNACDTDHYPAFPGHHVEVLLQVYICQHLNDQVRAFSIGYILQNCNFVLQQDMCLWNTDAPSGNKVKILQKSLSPTFWPRPTPMGRWCQ